jgi:hypothetical protein
MDQPRFIGAAYACCQEGDAVAAIEGYDNLNRSARLIWRCKADELKGGGVEASALQHFGAIGQRIADGFNAAVRQVLRRVDFERHVLASPGEPFGECEPIGRAADGALGIASGSG